MKDFVRGGIALKCWYCTTEIEDDEDWALLLNKRPAHARCLPKGFPDSPEKEAPG